MPINVDTKIINDQEINIKGNASDFLNTSINLQVTEKNLNISVIIPHLLCYHVYQIVDLIIAS